MSKKKTERQLNLVICLMATRRYLTAREIRATVAGYGDADTEDAAGDVAFKRMFERDKAELRASGIAIETGGGDVWSGEEGYRISAAAATLPEIALHADEAAVLGLAARAWRHAALGGTAAGAVMKLRAAGVPVDTGAAPAVTPVLGADEPAFLAVWQAVRDRRPIEFDYRKPGAPQAERRLLEPWGIVNVRGRWYVAGHDRIRGARRVFRLGRMVGQVRTLASGPPVEVPDGVDVRSVVSAERAEPVHSAVLHVRGDSGHVLRRSARRIVPGAATALEDRWDELTLPYTDRADLVRAVAGFGERAVVVEPADARDAVAAHLAAVAEAPPAGPVPDGGADAGGGAEDAAEPPRSAVAAEQLRRLLMLVPYAIGWDVRVPDVAAQFGVSEKQVLKDLALLWMCGLPGYTPGDLIDVDLEAAESTGEIIISNADTLARPLRLTADEAASLIAGLDLLAELPGAAGAGADGGAALKRVREKLREAAGSAAEEFADAVTVRVDLGPQEREKQRRCQHALEQGQRLHLRYLSGYVDEVTERDVDPMGLLIQDGHAFLEGWCRLRGGVRLFRLDRVLDLTVLAEPAAVPGGVRRRDFSAGLLPPSEADAHVTLDLEPEARWVTEDYVCTGVRELGGGRVRATLRTPVPGWVRGLALRLGPAARVVAPADVAEQVRADARRALDRYASGAQRAPQS
ncbi:helix-turn-helix transcriptional regulator [Nocardiopsis coralliicola]